MPELTTIPAADLAEMKDRLTRLAREKAQLQLIALLMNRLSELPGLEKTVEGMLQFAMDILGGLNVTIFYRIDEAIHSVDVHGKKEVVTEIQDDLVRQVFETREFASRERDFGQTGMTTKEFTNATTWVMPLLVGVELVGVLRMDDLLVAGRELREEVQTFLRYASLLLKNQISGETRLRHAFDEVSRANRELKVEVAQRKRADEELQLVMDDLERRVAARTAELRGIIEGTTSPIFSLDREYRYLAFNQSHISVMRALYGVEIEADHSMLDYMGVTGDREKAKENLDRALAGEHLMETAYSGKQTQTRRCFEVSHHPIWGNDGQVIGVAVFASDVTERERAEAERQATLRFFENMDRVNRAMQGTNDLEQMMSDVLDAVLASFHCDRAWLVYPCDPETASYRVPMERTRPEFPGALARGLEVPIDKETAQVLRAAKASSGPVTFGPGSDPPLPTFLTKRFCVQSQITMAIYPKVAMPYVFGLHQCSYPRIWTAAEKSLFQAIGWRLADSLTSLLAYRSLKESEERYRRIVDTAAEGIWVLGPNTMTVFVNAKMAEMIAYSSEEIIGRPTTDFMFESDTADHLRMIEKRRQGLSGTYERRFRRKDGETVWAMASGTPIFDDEHRFGGSFAMFTDITERKRAEGRIRKEAERGSLLLDVFMRSLQMSETQIYDEALDLAVRLTDSAIGFFHRVSDDQKTIILTARNKQALEGRSAAYETNYPAETAGNWVDCVRLGVPVVYNDVPTSPDRKGLPLGDAPVRRFMSVPVMEGDKVRIIFGVGNKATEYEDDDVFQIQQIANELQKILKQRRAAEALSESEEKYRAIFENSPLGIFRSTFEGRFLEVSPALATMLGHDSPEAVLRDVQDIGKQLYVHPEERQGFVSEHSASPDVTFHLNRYRRKDGSEFIANLYLRTVRDAEDRPAFLEGILEDVTERVQAEEALRAERGLFVRGPSVVFQWKAQEGWPVEYVSPNVTDQLGYTPDELISGKVGYATIVHPDDLARVAAEVSAYGEQGVASFEQMYRIAHADGRYRWVDDFTTVIRGRNGAITHYLGYLQDTTERKRAEQEIARVNRALRMLSDSNQALIRITDEETLVNEVCRIAVDVGGYRMVWVGFAEQDEARTVRPVARAGVDSGYLESVTVSWADTDRGLGPGGTAIRTGRPCVARNIPEDPAFAPWREAAVQRGYNSLIALPIVSEVQTFGLLCVYSGEIDAFDSREVAILNELAGDLAFGLTALRMRTKRERAEEALRESEERYRLIAANTADTITVLDFDLRFVYISPSVLKLRGYSAEETMIQPLDQVFTPESLQEIKRLFADQMALEASGTADPSRTASLELEEYCKDGHTIWVEVALSFLRDATLKPTGILAVTRDITRRMEADHRLVESEQKYRSLADSSPDNIVRYDADRRLVYVNRNMGLTVGFDLASYIGRTHTESAGFPGVEAYRAKLLEVIQSGQPDELEVVVVNPAGELRTHNIRFVAERNDEGTIIGALAFGRDVTERKDAAREKQKYHNQLRHNLEDTVTAIAATVEARDPYTAGHQRHVAALAAAMATELRLGEEAVQGIHIAGTIHDLGKIKIPAEILARPGQLSEIETRLIQLHPEAGWEILKGVEFPWPIAEMVLEHHERLDGSGYPNRLKGEQISLGARILAVADVVEAMATHRPYRPSRGLDFALSEIERDRGVLYDADVVDACLRLFREKGYQFRA